MTSPFWDIDKDEGTLYTSWWHWFTGEMFVLVLVAMSLAIMGRIGIIQLVVALQNYMQPSFHLPSTAKLYTRMCLEIAFQLAVALMLFFGLCLMIVVTSVNKSNEWMKYDEQEGYYIHKKADSLVHEEATRPMLKKKTTVLTTIANRDQYDSFRSYFFKHITTMPGASEALMDVPMRTFHFWYFLGLIVSSGVKSVFKIHLITWVLFLILLWLFCCGHYLLHITYYSVMVVTLLMSVSVLVYMKIAINKEQERILAETDRTPRQNKVEAGNRKLRTEAVVSFMIQFPTFLCCWAIARLVCSSWMWIYYPRTAVLMFLCGVCFFFVYRLVIAPLCTMFFVVYGLPPHIDVKDMNHIRQSAIYSKEAEKLAPSARRQG